jgi:ubiquinol-cytochrome c reductase iron-sulfur subunit
MTQERRIERIIAICFGAAALAGVALLAVYVLGGQTQVEGVLLAISLGGIGLGIVLWAQRLLPNDLTIEERHDLTSEPSDVAFDATREAETTITRRTMLLRMLAAAIGGLGAALAIPIFSLGPVPGKDLFQTPWRNGLRLVDLNNAPIKAADIPVDGLATVFPEGSPGSADGQALLIHVGPGLLQLSAARLAQAPQGYVVYSKVCTHAGCAVGLYRAEEHRLICPCHQSTFDVLAGATPTFGPAARPLPQLPIQLQADGTFVALGDFPDPVGPSFWNIHSGG